MVTSKYEVSDIGPTSKVELKFFLQVCINLYNMLCNPGPGNIYEYGHNSGEIFLKNNRLVCICMK